MSLDLAILRDANVQRTDLLFSLKNMDDEIARLRAEVEQLTSSELSIAIQLGDQRSEIDILEAKLREANAVVRAAEDKEVILAVKGLAELLETPVRRKILVFLRTLAASRERA